MTFDGKREVGLLKSLQIVDAALQAIQHTLDTVPERRAVLEADYVAAKAALTAKQSEREIAEKYRRFDELELAADVDRIRERETKLYAIKTNKEYQAALKEIAEGKRLNREREDRILKQMEVIESTGKEITQLLQASADKEAECRTAVEALAAEARTLEADRATKTGEREGLLGQLHRDVIRLYEHVRQRLADPVAPVRRGICQGCNMRIPPQQFIELQRGTALTQCPSCHRLLYPVEETAAPMEKTLS